MSSVTTPWDVRAAITARITALVPTSDYYQDTLDAWRESKTPLLPEFQPEVTANLAFFVDDREFRSQDRQNSADFRADCPVTVRFLYRIRAADRVNDWDRAAKAAKALLAQLATWQPDDFDLYFNEATLLRQPLATDVLAVSLRFNVIYFISV